MKAAFPHSAHSVPVSRQAGLCLAELPPGKAKTVEKGEGKIKQTGTMSGRFVVKFLSAHCFGARRTAPQLWCSRAAILRKALAWLGFDRHHGRRLVDFQGFWAEARA
jgi:hypothetical protein